MADAGRRLRMVRLVGQWRRSRESAARFARRHGMSPWTFWNWRRKLGASEPRPGAAAEPTFVPVQVAREAGEPVIEIVWKSGERLHVRAGASADLVRAAVAALRSPC